MRNLKLGMQKEKVNMKPLLVILFLISTLCMTAVNIDEELKKAENVYGKILVGRGLADTAQEADLIALQDLTSQIIVQVKSNFTDSAKDDGVNITEYCERIVNTYSDVQLIEARKIEEKVGKQVKVARYITEENKQKIFDNRKNEIVNFILEGQLALAKNNVTDFLRNYYWAYMLLKSHPDGKTMTYLLADQERLIYTALPQEMERILKDIKIELVNIDFKPQANCSLGTFKAIYQGRQISGLLVSYMDGYSWSQPSKWTNGDECIHISNNTIINQKKLQFKIDYTFADHSFTGSIDSTIKNIPLKNLLYAEKEVKLTPKDIEKAQLDKDSLIMYDKSVNEKNRKTINDVINAIEDKEIHKAQKHFTLAGFKQFNDLIGYGHANIMPVKALIKQDKIAQDEIVGALPMNFNFMSSPQPFTERVKFVFNADGKIDGISFALTDQAVSDILRRDFDSPQKQAIIINFLEQYKTAYCLKDLDFIENVFSNDALIIVGRMVKSEPDPVNDGLYNQLDKKTVEYVKLSKKEYVSRLSNQFKKKEFINIHFEDNFVTALNDKNVYGIQIKQYYYSSNYADKGYLFLMFDLNDIDHPKIMVRSWQPEKNPDGSIVGFENFHWE